MNRQSLSVFRGIAPRYAPHLKPGMAITAEGVDLTSGKLRPEWSPLTASGDAPDAGANSLIRYNGAWLYAKDACFTKIHDNYYDLLVYLDSGRLMKRCGSASAPLGQTRPSAPTVKINAADNAAVSLIGGAYRWTRSNKVVSLMGNSAYIWIKSDWAERNRTWYYCLSASRGNPHFNSGSEVDIDREWFDNFKYVVYDHHSGHSTALYVQRNEPLSRFGDHDGLGFSTLYVTLPSRDYEGYPNEDPSAATRTNYIKLKSTEYFLEASGGGAPGITKPSGMQVEGSVIRASLAGTVGDLYPGEWGWGHLDSDCSFDTIYVSLKDGIDPDTKTSGYVAYLKYASDINDENIYYLTTWVRNVNGHIDESGPSAAAGPISVEYAAPAVTRPACSDSLVTHWRVYRLESSVDAYLLVDEVPIATETYIDCIGLGDLSESCPCWYTNSSGDDVIWSPPPITDAEGLFGPHIGSLFAYRGSRLYWSEPGTVDAWPALYYCDLPYEITGGAGGVVMTSGGPFRLDGSTPESLMPVACGGAPGCRGACAQIPGGVVYLSDGGLEMCDGYSVTSLTDQIFDSVWLDDLAVGSLAYKSGRIYAFGASSALRMDTTDDNVCTTMSIAALASWSDPENDQVFVLTAAGAVEIESDSAIMTAWTWRSGDLLGAPADAFDHSIEAVRCVGKGLCNLSVDVDGRLAGAKLLNLGGAISARRLLLPEGTSGRAAQVTFSAPPTYIVDEIGKNLGTLPASGQVVLELCRMSSASVAGDVFTSASGLRLSVSGDSLTLVRPDSAGPTCDISGWTLGDMHEIRIWWDADAAARLFVDGGEVS